MLVDAVTTENGTVREAFPTDVTVKWLFSCVNTLMAVQRLLLSEHLVACGTLILAITGMH